MLRTFIYAIIFLALAQAFEVAILPQFLTLAPHWMGTLFDPPFLALAGILFGLLRGEVGGMVVAFMAACLLGFSQPPGLLGASIVSFSTAAFLSGLLARHLWLQGFLARWVSIMLLLIIDRLIWCLMRQFWDTKFTVPFLAILMTALVGAIFFMIFAPGIRLNLSRPEED